MSAPKPTALNVGMSGRPSPSIITSIWTRTGARPEYEAGMRSCGGVPRLICGGSTAGLLAGGVAAAAGSFGVLAHPATANSAAGANRARRADDQYRFIREGS